MEELTKLINVAKEASLNSYAPYSRIFIGASLLTKEGKLFLGCNIENSSYGLSICAERAAIANAISNGFNKFDALAIYSEDIYPVPCGACAQFIAEFSKDLKIVVSNGKKTDIFKLDNLLPQPFNLINE